MNDSSTSPSHRPTLRQRWQALPQVARIIIVLGFVAIAWLGLRTGNDTSSTKSGKGGPASVGVVTVTSGDIHVYLKGLGTITPRNIVTVRSRIDGELLRIAFTEGQSVQAGDVLAEIDPRSYKAQLAQATGQLLRDQALLKDAKANLERYKTLFAQDSIAKQQLDTQMALVKQYEGAVHAGQGQVDNSKVQLDYTRITSPISGRVGLRQIDPGNLIHAGDTNGLVVVTQLQPITAIFSLPEDTIPDVMPRIKDNVALAVEAWSRDDKIRLATGTLIAVDNQVDPSTGTVKFKAEFPNEDGTLFANQFVNIRMLLETRENATLVPSAGVQRGTQGTYTYVVNTDNTATQRIVKTGASESEITQILDGVSPGDVIVVDGTDALREGAKITIATRDGNPIDNATSKASP